MKRFIPFFAPVMSSFVLASVVMSVADVLYFWWSTVPEPTGPALLATSLLFAVALTTGVGAIFGVALVLLLPALRGGAARLGRGGDSEQHFVAQLPRLLVAPTGKGWRSIAASCALVVVAVIAGVFSDLFVPMLELNHINNTIAYAVWTTGALIVPLIIHRVVSWRWPRWAGVEWLVWLLIGGWAYHITTGYWVGASPFTLWAALPLILIPTAVGVSCLMRAAALERWFARFAIFVAVVSAIVLLAYPDRSPAHAHLSKGPVVAVGAWHILATLSDLDGDGATSFIGGPDCDGFDYDIRPTAVEIVGNGVDDNCFGGDLVDFPPLNHDLPESVWTAPVRPPVIVITVDTLRADALGRVVDDRPVTPTMDALMEGAVSFTNAYSTSSGTDESIPALMTGMYPSDWHQYGVYFGVEPTLAEVFGTAGYQTKAIVLLPWLRSALVHGFQKIDNSLGELHYRDERRLSSADTTRLALEYLDARDPDAPVFLWLHYFEPHMPQHKIPPLVPWLGDDAYAQNVHLADIALGDLFTGLDDRGLLDLAVIIFASDHGEALGEHNLMTHGWGVWESIVRIPMALRLPGIAPRRIDEPVSLVDVTPTILDYFQVMGGPSRDGRSLMPLIAGQPMEPRPIFIEAAVDKRPTFFSVIDDDMKLIVNLRRSAYYLFDLAADPQERDNLISERSDEADRLLRLLGEWRDSVFNDRRLDRKRALWESRSAWEPDELITDPDSWRTDEAMDLEK